MTTASSTEFDAVRWSKAVPLLTLDLLCPLYPSMGLSPLEPNRLQRTLREEMVRARRRFERDFHRTPAFAREWALAILAALEPLDARQIAKWISTVFHGGPTDNRDLRRWQRLLRHCSSRKELWNSLFFSPSTADEALGQFELSANIEEFDRRYSELSSQPLSDWDLHLYAIYFFDDDDSEGSPNGPYLWIAPTVRDFQAFKFWRWLVPTMGGADFTHFWERAQELEQFEALTPDEPLPDPTGFAATL